MEISSVRGGPHIAAETSAIQFAARREQSVELNVETEEGDKVTLSFRSEDEVEGIDYRGLEENLRRVRRTAEAQVEVQVEGELSQEELVDIRRLAQTLTQATRRAEQGKPIDTNKIAERLEKLDTVAEFDYTFEQSQEVNLLAVA